MCIGHNIIIMYKRIMDKGARIQEESPRFPTRQTQQRKHVHFDTHPVLYDCSLQHCIGEITTKHSVKHYYGFDLVRYISPVYA